MVDRLARTEPVRRLLGQHVDHYGEVLPNVFLSELADWVGQEVSQGRREPTTAVLDALERELRSYPAESDNLIAVGFVENLAGEPYAGAVRELAPPLLAAICDDLL